MSPRRTSRLVAAVAGCAAVAALTAPEATGAEPVEPAGLGYAHRSAPEKPDASSTGAASLSTTERLEVKFREGSGIRWSANGLRVSAGATRAGRAASDSDLAKVAGALDQTATITGPLFNQAPAELDDLARTAYEHSGRPQADLNLYYRVRVEQGSAAALIDRLNALEVVEIAYPAPEPAPLPVPDFVPTQGYAAPSKSNGIGIGFARRYTGGTGANVRVHDVEYSWNASHVDLTQLQGAVFYQNGVYNDPFDDKNHGTAVLGEIVGDANTFGVTGLVPDASIQLTNTGTTQGLDIPNAVLVAADALAAGDVMLIEQQTPGAHGGCGEDQAGCVAVEWVPSVYDAVVSAVSRGINLVEAAGNGAENLDDPVYGSTFPRGLPDSGAIIVGAAGSGLSSCHAARSRLNFSTYGRRVNLFAWGECIVTSGYGDLYQAEGINGYYTDTFGGTSGASPIVTSAVAAISSIAEANGTTLTPAYVRKLLTVTGRAGVDTAIIGRQPNLRSAIPRMFGQVAGNDRFRSAAKLFASQSVDNSGSTRQAGEPRHAGNVGGASVWYRYKVPGNGILKLTTRGSRFDTTLAVYRGTHLRSLRLLGANDDVSDANRTSRLKARVKDGQRLRIALDGYDGLTGTIKLHADFVRR